MPTYYVLADSGFGTQDGVNRTVVGYPDGAKIPEVIKKKAVRINDQQFKELFRHLYGMNADTYVKLLGGQ